MKKGLLLSENEFGNSIKQLIRGTLERNKPTFRYTDDDIATVKTACGTDLDINVLDESVSVLEHFFEGNVKWHLIVRIQSITSASGNVGTIENSTFF